MLETSPQKTDRIDLRLTKRDKAFLQEASRLSSKTITDFLLEHGLKAAEQVLIDKRVFTLSDVQWKHFQEALDRPLHSKPHLENLLATPSVFEK